MIKADRDLIIIGSGPAGLSSAQYGARSNLNLVVLEEISLGGQALLISALENYPGISATSLKSGYDFIQDMQKQALNFGAHFIMQGAQSLKKEGDIFIVELGNGKTITSLSVILATGAKHKKLDVIGEEKLFGMGVSYCAVCDGPFFKGEKIFVVGGGDSACDEANLLSRISSHIVMLHRRDTLRAQKALAERVLQNPSIEVRFNTQLKEIRGEEKVTSLILQNSDTGKVYEEEGDAVFVSIGTVPQTNLVPNIPKDENGYIITDQNMATSVPGLFVAGDVRATPFRQVVVACGEGAIAAHSAVEYVNILKCSL